MYYFKLPRDTVGKKPFTTSLKFQLLNTHTYEKKAALLIFCCNGMGNVPPFGEVYGEQLTAFSIQKISDDFAVILRRSEDIH